MIYFLLTIAILMTITHTVHAQGKFAQVNGLRVYYEIQRRFFPIEKYCVLAFYIAVLKMLLELLAMPLAINSESEQ